MEKELYMAILEELYSEKETDEEIYIDADIKNKITDWETYTEKEIEEANTNELAKCNGKFIDKFSFSTKKRNTLKDIEEQIFDLEKKRFFSDALLDEIEITKKINSLMEEYTRIENEI